MPATPFKPVSKPLEWFIPNDENYRGHPQQQQEILQASLRQFGAFKNVVARPDGTVLCGHGIIAAAKAEGLKQFPVHIFEGTDAEARALMVADNEVSRLAEDDPDQLSQLLESLRSDGLMDVTGHDDGSLAALLDEVANANAPTGFVPQEEEGPGEPPAEPVTRPGDVWLMGEHRLVCGDSREAHLWEALLGKRKVRLVWTDPPYGVGYVGGTQDPRSENYRSGKAIANDSMTEQETEVLCRDALAMASAFGEVGAACYVSIPGTLLRAFVSAYSESGFTLKHSLTWVKQQFVFGRCDYHYRHETILYGWKEDGAHYFVDDHTKDSVFQVDKPHRSEEHPTMKPVELVAQMVANSSRVGETVADPFLGSGTTLIACEQLKRKCVGIELSPAYCDVIVNRWQKLTGKQAVLEATGETFDALKK